MNLVGSFLVAFGIWLAGYSWVSSRRPTPLKLASKLSTERRSVSTETFSRVQAEVIRKLIPPSRIRRLEGVIARAGQPDNYSVEKILTIKILASLLLGFLGVIYYSQEPGTFRVVAIIVAFVGGFVVPEMLVSSRADARREVIEAGLPDAIDQLAVTVRAGLSVDSAIVRVSTTLRGPLADELSRVVQDIQIGMARTEALKAMADRMDIADLNQFVRALIQADSLGIPIANTLSIQADEMRTKRRQRAEEQAMKLPVKILAPTAVCILPALLIVVLGPVGIQLARNL